MDETKKKVFIVDDDEFLLDMYAVKFRESGFEIEIASSGADALGKIKGGWTPDVVLLDLVMPGMDGFEFLKSVKSEKLIPQAVIIILTNLGQKEDVERGMSLGVKDYVIKANHTPSEVVAKVKLALGSAK
ncbi:MAG: response regulator transcription factor [Candidatus Niyogibacteria bacterium]|nr:response regulator transcription factor [Candidatus Niyogibacteria bacterium]